MAEIQIQKENRGLLLSHYSLEKVDFMGDPGSFWASLVAQMIKTLPAMQETWVRSLGQEDPPLENESDTM